MPTLRRKYQRSKPEISIGVRNMYCSSNHTDIMKTAILVTLTVMASACATVMPAPPNAVFVATFKSETLKGSNTPMGSRTLCDETFSHGAHTSQENQICVHTACGWSEVSLRVTERLSGSVPYRVRLRSTVGEWCRPIFYDQQSDTFVVVTGAQDPITEGVSFEFFPLFTAGSDGLAFVPYPQSPFAILPNKLSSEQLESLLKPIPPYVFRSKEEFPPQQLQRLLQLPYVCEQGDDLAYCKAISLADFMKAIRPRS